MECENFDFSEKTNTCHFEIVLFVKIQRDVVTHNFEIDLSPAMKKPVQSPLIYSSSFETPRKYNPNNQLLINGSWKRYIKNFFHNFLFFIILYFLLFYIFYFYFYFYFLFFFFYFLFLFFILFYFTLFYFFFFFFSYYTLTNLFSTLIKMVINSIPLIWTPNNNSIYPVKIKKVVKILFLCRKRRKNILFNLPKYLLFSVINFYIYMEPSKYFCEWDTSLFGL